MEAFSRYISVIILVVFLFLVPTLLFSINHDNVVESYVQSTTVDFTENVKKQGRITADMMNRYIQDLNKTGYTFDVSFTHTRDIVTPVYDASGTVIGTTSYPVSWYTDQITDLLFTRSELTEELADMGQVLGEYRFYQGDYFTVEVRNKRQTISSRIRSLIFRESSDLNILVTYGGRIEDENY